MFAVSCLYSSLFAGLAVWFWYQTPELSLMEKSELGIKLPKWAQGKPGSLPPQARLVTGMGAGVAFTFWASWLYPANVLLGVAGSFAVAIGLGYLETSKLANERQRLIDKLPKVCDLLVVCLESGLPFRQAVSVVAQVLEDPLAQQLAEVATRVDLGADEAQAWLEVADVPGLETFAREISRCLRTGVSLAPVLSALSNEKRSEAFSAREVAARRVGVRSVLPLMVCFLPAFVLLGVVPIIGGMILKLWP